ncbi:hypothetical protein [Thermococcus sp. 21S7]|uniref:hypothetical protein n=1 Tax=Thermococcus sp. 21S7 TaxID=1638221 RepID=UPI00143BE682|nr:hypothetical protein [Thermococcus sp. 21S7]NJE60473.1 hypothetical protein [Thermococcus sp. 21S7]
MENTKKLILMRYFQEPKRHAETYIRENEVLSKIITRMMEKYELNSKQKVYELAVLSMALDIEPEKLAPLLANRTKSSSRKALLHLYESLLHLEAEE